MQGYLYAPEMLPEAFERWLIDYVAGQAQMMRESVGKTRSQPTPAWLTAFTRG